MSIYALKPRFQALLRPLVGALHRAGVTANQVTLAACAVSVLLGLWIFLQPAPALFALIPLWMFLRMALNAIDGMLAREFGQKSALGAYLNELTDVIADACLYLPFAALAVFSPLWVGGVHRAVGDGRDDRGDRPDGGCLAALRRPLWQERPRLRDWRAGAGGGTGPAAPALVGLGLPGVEPAVRTDHRAPGALRAD